MSTDIKRIPAPIRAMAQLSLTRTMLSKLHGQHFDGARDLYEVCGYPRVLTPADHEEVYRRGDIGARILDAFPDATWRDSPIIKAEGDKTGEGAFKKAVDQLAQEVNLWYALKRLDLLMGMGHYGVMLIGMAGAEPLESEVKGKNHKVIYLAPHSERTADVTWWENNPTSPRYGKPLIYNITTGVGRTGHGGGERRVTVHHSRVIHIAERALDDVAIGQPRLERVWNRLMDVDKTVGGAAEIYWQNAALIRAWVAAPDVEWDPAEQKDMEAQLEELQHGLRRDLRLRGVEPKPVAGSPADPAGAFDKALDLIAGAIGIPKRILIGSERGELSSEQDEVNWAARVEERRKHFADPLVIRPFVDRCIEYGILKPPEGGKYVIEWPGGDGLGAQAKAEIADKNASALQRYVQTPGAEFVVPVEEFRSTFLGLDPVSQYQPEELEGRETGVDETDPEVKDEFAQNRKRRLVANAGPRTLYVRRNVLNAKDIVRWAKAQGFESLTPPEDMHVTIAYSEQPVDWMKVGEAWTPNEDGTLRIAPGGARLIERLGPDAALVLMFTSSELSWRWFHIKSCGASWKYGEDYQPHITLSYKGDPALDLKEIEPYRGPIILGPEIFEEVTHDWASDLVEIVQ